MSFEVMNEVPVWDADRSLYVRGLFAEVEAQRVLFRTFAGWESNSTRMCAPAGFNLYSECGPDAKCPPDHLPSTNLSGIATDQVRHVS